MIITEIPFELKLPESKTPRSKGVHLSGIIRSIAGLTGILKAEWCDDLSLVDVREVTDQASVLRMCIGLAWEEWFIPQLPNVVDHPGEMELSGIYMTPDGESVDVIITSRGRLAVHIIHEAKATYKSTRTVGDFSNQWMWLTQCKGYCKAAGTRFATMYVLFICGDYKYPLTPQLKVWQIEFTQEDLDQTWADLREYMTERLEIDKAEEPGGYVQEGIEF